MTEPKQRQDPELLLARLRASAILGRIVKLAERRVSASRSRRWIAVGFLAGLLAMLPFVASDARSRPAPSARVAAPMAAEEITRAALSLPEQGPELRAVAAYVMVAVRTGDRWAPVGLIVDALRVVGRSGVSGAGEWARPALVHPRAEVRRAAAVWYPVIDPGFASDPETAAEVKAASNAKDP